MSAVEVLVIVCVSMAGAVVHGSVGIGLTLVAGPALIAIDPGFAPGPLLVAGQLVGVRHMYAERQHLDQATYRRCVLGLPIGIGLGVVVLAMMSEKALAMTIGLLTASAAALLLSGWGLQRSTVGDVAAGAACSFSSLTAGLPGPPLVVAFSDLKPPSLRATTAAYIMTVAVIAFGTLVATGNFGRHEAELSAWLVPGIVAGVLAARWVRPLVDRAWFRPAVLIVAFAGGLALVARQLT